MICPNCKTDLQCPCENCQKRNAGKPTWIWVTGNGPWKCSVCGRIITEIEAQEIEWQEYQEFRKNDTENETLPI